MGRKKQGKFVQPANKGKEKRHKMKGKSVEAFTEEMHTAFEASLHLEEGAEAPLGETAMSTCHVGVGSLATPNVVLAESW
ncbi:hypothetical protein E3U43_012550 [Larimichthys crocea]|uniref:Uncharacterized protein n=1 Tax=Larimichthys crocea TaxID=215358 RepID=A0ACD3RSL2_LARCR|nr:hypothetical protein E3U43_012550 [Larimichthys crocea]